VLKLTYSKSRISKFSRGGPPDLPLQGEGREGERREEREGKCKGKREGKDREGRGGTGRQCYFSYDFLVIVIVIVTHFLSF